MKGFMGEWLTSNMESVVSSLYIWHLLTLIPIHFSFYISLFIYNAHCNCTWKEEYLTPISLPSENASPSHGRIPMSFASLSQLESVAFFLAMTPVNQIKTIQLLFFFFLSLGIDYFLTMQQWRLMFE